ncbi:HAMP domain-containing protein [Paenibacillus oralis]|uniref:HAMP domain-containing protein n=1 Tax=Paenibacillus oralis TaxID=2490856 RepID=A0A3P3U0G7_9BACL|nr:histidine kinase [Paenibacillus oralis]RRJ63416.1 HAMP domain-containing protein [Paenibacillus oralis]
MNNLTMEEEASGVAGLKSLWPSGIKNRLFLSILLFVLVPSSFLQLRSINQLETNMKANISQQNVSQLNLLKNGMEDIRIGVLGAMLQLEREPGLKTLLLRPDDFDEAERNLQIGNQLLELKQGLGNALIPVHITLADNYGHVYTTTEEGVSVRSVTGSEITGQPEFKQLKDTGQSYAWAVHESRDVLQDIFPQAELYSLYARLQEVNGRTFGYLRISLDIRAWLQSITNGFQVKQTYYLFDGARRPILLPQDAHTAAQLAEMDGVFANEPSRYVSGANNMFIYNGIYLPNLDWTLVTRFPLEALSGNIRAMKNQVLVSFSLTVVVFIAVTYAIVASVLRPLRTLQRTMKELVHRDLDVRIPEWKFKGELLVLARTFNGMIGDIRGLISRLKTEERQKEAFHFQMLMSQMNPHFLLNTLNTVKWNARNHGDMGTFEICQNLGRLLESSLNTEVDLVHLKEEIELVKAYVYIQSFRYDHAFTAEYEIGKELQYALVPKLSLQPLVENAIQHGLVHVREGGAIRIAAMRAGQKLRLEIRDNGQGLAGARPEQGRKRKGIGIGNLRERLELLFRRESSLTLVPLEQGTMAVLEMPLLIASPYQKPPLSK